ncbi:MAG: rod shape-determining protein MreC [Oscillospiraceae bacterium]|nr:rod shape-determining protein MreC [Oscillospiraceae bacterium]
MRNRKYRKSMLVAAAAALIALITLVSVIAGSGGVISRAVDTVMRPVKRASASVVLQLESLYGYMHEYDKLREENTALEAKIVRLESERRETAEIEAENERFRELYGLATRYSGYSFDTATILTWTASNYSSSFTINKGTANSTVEVGDSVITESGVLIGVVTAVEEHQSTAISIVDTKFSAGCIIESSGDSAVASGDYTLMRRELLKLAFVNSGTKYLSGDTIVTSGRGGVYPKGLVIGTIDAIETSADGASSFAAIKPSARLSELTDVYLITDFDTAE